MNAKLPAYLMRLVDFFDYFADFLPERRMALLIVFILIGNTMPVIGVMFFGWSFQDILFIYWAESGIIAFFTFFKIIIAGIYGKGSQTLALIPLIAVFFLIHFGGFMGIHLLFLIVLFDVSVSLKITGGISGFFESAAFALMVMALTNGLNFFSDFIRGREYVQSSEFNEMLKPYGRLVPIHLTLIFCGGVAGKNARDLAPVVIFFISLKIAIELIALWLGHWIRKGERRRSS